MFNQEEKDNFKKEIEERCIREISDKFRIMFEERYRSEINLLQKQIEKLLEQKGNTIINIEKQINLNSYGNEDLSHITADFKDELLKVPYVAIPKMIEEVHFSNKKPENKNIILPNKKENLIKVFEQDKWVFKDKKTTISKLVDNKYNIIDRYYKVNKDTINNDQRQYEEFRKIYNSENSKDLKNNLQNDCELILLNNR